MKASRPIVRMYCAGGAGMNLGNQPFSDIIEPCFLDSSRSNRPENHDPEKCVFLEGVDGSGGDRRRNYALISQEIPTFMEHFVPGDFNIVLFSAAGGTGSVAGPLMLSYLLERGLPAIAVVIGADDTQRRVNNTIGTLKTLETISASKATPLVMSYHENVKGMRESVDQQIAYLIAALSHLLSQDNEELDKEDLVNWVQYHRVSSAMPQLASLSVYDSRQAASGHIEPISIVSLYDEKGKDSAFGNAPYQTSGFPRTAQLLGSDQLHFVINHADVGRFHQQLEDRKAELNRLYSGYQQRPTIVNRDDDITPDGVVFE